MTTEEIRETAARIERRETREALDRLGALTPEQRATVVEMAAAVRRGVIDRRLDDADETAPLARLFDADDGGDSPMDETHTDDSTRTGPKPTRGPTSRPADRAATDGGRDHRELDDERSGDGRSGDERSGERGTDATGPDLRTDGGTASGTDGAAASGTDGGSASETDGATSGEDYADLGATTERAMEIAETSMDRVREIVPQETLADRLRGKAVHATGDPEFHHLLRFTGDDENEPVRAGARAIREERPIVTDITMVESGITGRGHDCPVRKAIGNGTELAAETGMTRTAASVLELDRQGVYEDSVAVVGNAPTAALALADAIADGTRPAVVIATPVGFVKAAESRDRLRTVAAAHDVPAVTNVGRRGGSGVAAGLTNELVHVASDARDGEVDL